MEKLYQKFLEDARESRKDGEDLQLADQKRERVLFLFLENFLLYFLV